MTLESAVKGFKFLLEVSGQRVHSTAAARLIFVGREKLRKDYDFLVEEEQKLIEEHGGSVTETGEIIFRKAEDESDENAALRVVNFNKARKELGEMDSITSEIRTIPLSMLEGADIRPDDLTDIAGWLIDIEH